jgi:hypothetical protein
MKRLLAVSAAAISTFAFFAGCDSGAGCADTEVEVSYLGGGTLDGTSECKPIPTDCGTTASCADQKCTAALYGLCATGYNGVGCSDTAPPTIVSCNP